MVREAGFAKVHCFTYSPREGTPAAAWNEAVPPTVVRTRRQRLQELGDELADAYARSLLGRRLDVLVETADLDRLGLVRGTACRAVTVAFRGHLPALIRRRVPVRAIAVRAGVVVGEPEPDGGAEDAVPLRPLAGRLPLQVV